MLQVPRLDDLDYKALMDRARALIPTLTGEWTDFNDHDPGITTLQAFAWLCDGLNYYINATGERHRLKYFKLLGIEPESAAARCRVAVQVPDGGEFSLPRGARLLAGDIPFELEKECGGTANQPIRLYTGPDDGHLLDLTAFAGQDGEFASVFSADGKPGELFLGFAHPLSGTVRLFFEIGDCGRNPFSDDFARASLEWNCFGAGGWQSAQVLSDETGGLLRSGYLTLSLPCETVPASPLGLDTACYLRCRLLENEYDLPPQLGRVVQNCADAVQRRSWAEAERFFSDGSAVLPLNRAVCDGMRLSVAVRDGDDYLLRDGFCETAAGERPWLREIRFDSARFGWAPRCGDELLVIFTDREAEGRLSLGVTDGCASQQFAFDVQGLLELELALIDPDSGRFALWERCEDLAQAGCEERVFAFDESSRTLTFGDGICGEQPEPGLLVTAVTMRTSLFDGGNVLRGQIRTLDFPTIPGVEVANLESATGGIRRLCSAELEPLLEKKLRAVTRAVTADDYRTLVMGTPGLLIGGVAVIPMREYAPAAGLPFRPNTVVVAVQPGSARPLPLLGERYRRRIREHLETARLLTTDIEVVPARYVGVSVYGRISLVENNSRGRERVVALLRAEIDTVSSGTFGRGADYGRIFSALEMMEEVRGILQLSLEYIGAGGRKNEHGDIIVSPDSLCYLDETGIEFL